MRGVVSIGARHLRKITEQDFDEKFADCVAKLETLSRSIAEIALMRVEYKNIIEGAKTAAESIEGTKNTAEQAKNDILLKKVSQRLK